MLGMKLVRLIERHSDELSRELMEQVLNSEHPSDFQKIPPEDLRLAATDLYRNLEEWYCRRGKVISRVASRPWPQGGWRKGSGRITWCGR